MSILKELYTNLPLLGITALIVTFLISIKFKLYSNIIEISKIKALMDEPNERKMHTTKIPNLGGVGLFISFSLSIIVFMLLVDSTETDFNKLLALISSTIILLFIGIKDDLVTISPKKKLIGQLIAVLNVVVLTDVRISSFEGILGIAELPYIFSVLFSIFVFVLVVNAMNLIDGIDGLAGSISVLSSATFGILFLLNERYEMTLISFTLVGALLGFLKYNLSSKQKIFMGDCGSLLVGFLLAYQGVCFLMLNSTMMPSEKIANAPILLLAVLSYPLFDLLRVFTIRIKKGRSPFSADANHIHHRLLRIGLNHKKATLFLTLCNAFIIGFAFLLADLNIHIQLVVLVLAGGFVYLLPFSKGLANTIRLDKGQIKNKTLVSFSEKLATKDTFEFDFRPINFFEDYKKSKNNKAISLPKDYIMNIEVVVEPEDELLENQYGDENVLVNQPSSGHTSILKKTVTVNN